MSRTSALASLVLGSTLLLAGCGGDSDGDTKPSTSSSSTAAPASDAEPATGAELTGDGFTLTAPEGWKEDDGSAAPSIDFEVLALDEPQGGFADNLNVVADPTLTRVKDLDELYESVTPALESGGAKDVEREDGMTLDGSEALVIRSKRSVGSADIDQLQLAVTHDDDGFVVTFSFGDSTSDDEQRDIAESVAATWRWTS